MLLSRRLGHRPRVLYLFFCGAFRIFHKGLSLVRSVFCATIQIFYCTTVNELRTFLNAISPLHPATCDHVCSLFSEVRYKRKDILTYEGQIQRYMYFVREGIQRSYYIKDHKEHVIAFTYPPSFSGIPESFLTQTPSRYFLECITDSTLLRISYEQLEAATEQHRDLERLLRKATEHLLIGVINRHYELMALSIEERFQAFVQRSSHLLAMVPHKYIASYLGINPTNFSKLLGKTKL